MKKIDLASPAHILVASLVGRRLIRDLADAERYVPVVLVGGDAAPSVEGCGAYWTTPNGSICYHPNAYNRKAFGASRAVRHCSTRRVEVGRDWTPLAAGAQAALALAESAMAV